MQKIILSTNSSKHFGLDNGDVEIGRFPEGEVSVVLSEDVFGKEVVVIGSTEPPAENLIELSFLIHKVGGDGAEKVTAIIPYFGYSRGDREAKKGEVASARVVAEMLQATGGGKLEVVFIDLHSPKISAFFAIPSKEISLVGDLAKKFIGRKDLTVVAPDSGARHRAEKFAKTLDTDRIVYIEKERLSPDRVEIKEITGEVGRKAVIVDDMVQTGGTILEVAEKLKEHGAEKIFVAASHMIYSAGGWKRLAESDLISKVVTTDTIKPLSGLPEKFEIIPIAQIIRGYIASLK
ncbi:MAG: Ribose-phosphate pyrophosphokinase [Candidatus Woesebacteria bacterium GW2011_GWB1_45_5]|uniref:ribose-phosphate diphosphokinase n=1 Tax=Candidatus Woesebacteria bacterium GW2011_GWB1_45_5 TaxID=1618581 RepID=A0A0G1MQF8_9BACT|nr:MAG: Ribose-phosphate pyrophosphokinase [Candidatus Woesebacteria bacterium GW2011_GWB1_45_5]